MASPVKAFIDPSGVYNELTELGKIPIGLFYSGFYFPAAPAQIETFVPRLTLGFIHQAIPLYPGNAPTPQNLNSGAPISLSTFAPIYQERNSTSARGTEGQVYPRAFD